VAWVFLVLAGLFETGFAVSLKLSHGFTRLIPSVTFCLFGLASFGLLTVALRSLPVGTAYAAWTGIGIVGTAAVGIFFLEEPLGLVRSAGIALIVGGVVVLNLAGEMH
jgi:quaternary ammonium compound-resistance protein SugE